jgi:hypothetical protein
MTGPVPPTANGRIGGWMQTFTGKAFYPLDPRPDEIDEDDIAHALSMICRYGGHTSYFYSVAEHCILVSEWVESVSGPYDALWALLHDAAEAYMGDMVRPLKRSMPIYVSHEETLLNTIAYKFGLGIEMPEVVHEADNRILLDERAKLMTMPPPHPWIPDEQGLEPLGVSITPMHPARARSEYRLALSRLTRLVSR